MYLQLQENNPYLAKKAKKDKRNPVAVVALAPGRALFNALVDMNVDGIATKLAKQNFADIRQHWLKAGGDPDKLAKNINKGKDKKPKKMNFLSKFKSGGQLAETANPFLQNYGPSYYLNDDGLTDAKKTQIIGASTALGTAIGTAIPAIGNVAGGTAGASLGGVIVAVYPMIKKTADTSGGDDPNTTPEPTPPAPDNTGTTDEVDQPGMSDKTKKMLIYGGIGVGAVALIYYLTKGKK